MREVLELLLRYARETWRFRWWMLGIAWVVCLIGWAVVARLPDKFQATARVFVDTQSVLAPLLSGLAIQTGSPERKVLLMTRTFASQPNMEKLLRMTDLDLKAKTPGEQEKLIDSVRKRIALAGGRDDNLYNISFSDESPEVAKLVVKSLLTIFMESNLGEVRKDQDQASQFIEQQIQDYERRMVEAEENLTRFKAKNLGFLPGESGGYYDSLRDATQKLEAAELELKMQQDRLEVLRKQMSGETPSFDTAPPPVQVTANTQEIDRRIQLNEVKLDELLLRFTEKHPDVVALRRITEDLKSQRKAIIAQAAKGVGDAKSGPFDATTNPVYQQMRIAMSQMEAEVAAKQAVAEDYRKKIKELESAVDRVLKVEGERGQLNRDYEILKRNHSQLMSRLEATRLARKADSRSESVRFRVIDPPRVPSQPSEPNRVLLSSAVLVAGLAVGFAIAFLMGQLRPTFDERSLLNEATGLPVLGSVNMVWTSDQVRARKVRNLSFLVSLMGLIVVYGLVLTVYLLGIDLLSKVSSGLGIA
jgi:polysaccharide chain length determinant protein (PEP-CTERM system associated)